jgi:hypothetical protein
MAAVPGVATHPVEVADGYRSLVSRFLADVEDIWTVNPPLSEPTAIDLGEPSGVRSFAPEPVSSLERGG